MNISHMPLDQLRDNITIIPQDSTIFTGTLRFNIDPNGNSKDEEIIQLLNDAGL